MRCFHTDEGKTVFETTEGIKERFIAILPNLDFRCRLGLKCATHGPELFASPHCLFISILIRFSGSSTGGGDLKPELKTKRFLALLFMWAMKKADTHRPVGPSKQKT